VHVVNLVARICTSQENVLARKSRVHRQLLSVQSEYVCVCVCIYIYINTYVYIYMLNAYIRICIYTHIRVCVYVYIYIYIYVVWYLNMSYCMKVVFALWMSPVTHKWLVHIHIYISEYTVMKIDCKHFADMYITYQTAYIPYQRLIHLFMGWLWSVGSIKL